MLKKILGEQNLYIKRQIKWQSTLRKEIVIRKDMTISYDEKNCYINAEIFSQKNNENAILDAKKIAELCKLELQNDAPHRLFLDKITARRPSDSRVQLFTTNYDTLFEPAAQKAGFVIIDGFSFTSPRTFSGRYFDYDIVNRERTRLKHEDSFVQKVFHLYKLYGLCELGKIWG